jgi:alkylation response protein AidB-like acyl-CoA dehydrogenase
MDFFFSSSEEAFRRELRAFLEAETPCHLSMPVMFVAVDFADTAIQTEWREMARKLGERGWLSLTWPEEWGGQGGSKIMEFLFIDELMYSGGLGYDVQGAGMVASLLLHFGTEKQKRDHLPGIAKGEVFWCQGFSEPDAGSDLASLRTRAIKDGSHYLITGQKVWTSRAHQADWCHLLARTDPEAPKHKGLSYFLVDMRTPGITVNPMEGMYGGQSLCEVFFNEVRVPEENVVGELNAGWSVALSLLNLERALYMEQVGVGRRVLEVLVEYANQQGLGKDPLVRQGLAEMATEVEVARLLGYRTAWLMDRGKPVPGEGSMCKIAATEWAQRWAHRGMELLGLYGQLAEDSELAQLAGRIQHWYIRSFALPVVAGTSEIERTVLATRGLKLPRG